MGGGWMGGRAGGRDAGREPGCARPPLRPLAGTAPLRPAQPPRTPASKSGFRNPQGQPGKFQHAEEVISLEWVRPDFLW